LISLSNFDYIKFAVPAPPVFQLSHMASQCKSNMLIFMITPRWFRKTSSKLIHLAA